MCALVVMRNRLMLMRNCLTVVGRRWMSQANVLNRQTVVKTGFFQLVPRVPGWAGLPHQTCHQVYKMMEKLLEKEPYSKRTGVLYKPRSLSQLQFLLNPVPH